MYKQHHRYAKIPSKNFYDAFNAMTRYSLAMHFSTSLPFKQTKPGQHGAP